MYSAMFEGCFSLLGTLSLGVSFSSVLPNIGFSGCVVSPGVWPFEAYTLLSLLLSAGLCYFVQWTAFDETAAFGCYRAELYGYGAEGCFKIYEEWKASLVSAACWLPREWNADIFPYVLQSWGISLSSYVGYSLPIGPLVHFRM